MPRIKLLEQEIYEFQHRIEVRPQDVNYGGHLGNDSLITLVGAARARLFRSMGLSELDLGNGSTGLIITDMAVNYKAEAFMFDELIIETHIGETAPKGFRMFHRVRRGPGLVALVEAGVATYNYALKKIVPVPAEFLERVALRHEKA